MTRVMEDSELDLEDIMAEEGKRQKNIGDDPN